MNELETILRVVPRDVRSILAGCIKEPDKLNEIRFRTGLPVFVKYKGSEIMLGVKGICEKQRFQHQILLFQTSRPRSENSKRVNS